MLFKQLTAFPKSPSETYVSPFIHLNDCQCRNGKHLANCTAAVCPHHYKCINYYCVPFSYTCDGRQDCPLGDDEQYCVNRTCDGLFKCQSSNKCLHFYEVGDGMIDCPDGDDELFTNLPICPSSCNCLMNALSCSEISTVAWDGDKLRKMYPFLRILGHAW